MIAPEPGRAGDSEQAQERLFLHGRRVLRGQAARATTRVGVKAGIDGGPHRPGVRQDVKGSHQAGHGAFSESVPEGAIR